MSSKGVQNRVFLSAPTMWAAFAYSEFVVEAGRRLLPRTEAQFHERRREERDDEPRFISLAEYMRADYVQDDPDWRELTGEPDDPIGIGETFVISGSYTDEVQRSEAYPGGVIVYRYTGLPAALSRGAIRNATSSVVSGVAPTREHSSSARMPG